MDPGMVTLVVGVIAGIGGVAAMIKAVADLRAGNTTQSVSHSEHLHQTAREWVDYIDGKFKTVSDELDKYKRLQGQRDRDLAVKIAEHGSWDSGIMADWLERHGEPYPTAPPPLTIPPPLYLTDDAPV